jgi:tetratricopeptide (TPR) repeat protein
MRKFYSVALFVLVVAAAGCATFTVAGQVQKGRQALLMNDPETALAYFLEAARGDPDYIYRGANFPESVWTYVGRGQYALGRYDEARRSFERALSVYRDDAMARLYLGLAMVRSGDTEHGLEDIQMGLKGLANWIEFLNRTEPYYPFWDPSANIRKEIDKTLALVPDERIASSLNTILENAEWIGQQMEEEIDKVRRDRRRRFDRDLDGRRGLSFGLGFGF